MNREVHVRFWERAEVKFLRATRQNLNTSLQGARPVPPGADMVGESSRYRYGGDRLSYRPSPR